MTVERKVFSCISESKMGLKGSTIGVRGGGWLSGLFNRTMMARANLARSSGLPLPRLEAMWAEGC